MAHRTPQDSETARILAAVAQETLSYTDPRADYPIARTARTARLAGVARRGPALTSIPTAREEATA